MGLLNGGAYIRGEGGGLITGIKKKVSKRVLAVLIEIQNALS